MLAAEFLIERLNEQIALAPKLQANDEPGGRYEEMVDRLQIGMNHASGIDLLQGVEGGPRRYAACFRRALGHYEQLKPILDKVGKIEGATYADGAQKEKARGQLRDAPKMIEHHCRATIAELEAAIKILDEGEGRAAKEGRLAGAGAK